MLLLRQLRQLDKILNFGTEYLVQAGFLTENSRQIPYTFFRRPLTFSCIKGMFET